MKACKTVEEYAKSLPEGMRAEFDAAWKTIRDLVPGGEEGIRYGMPTIRLGGKNLVHFAVMKGHFGFYPTPSGVAAFESEIAGKYEYSKGAIRFSIGKKLPLPLIRKIVKFRVGEERTKKK
ncbi:MAG: DUF1801 domain-containing protein [Candidatus Moranbacteria bacterium]|nr:DUF1801 domain-containing protein [Candidatus Moranbacteria bacterium]